MTTQSQTIQEGSDGKQEAKAAETKRLLGAYKQMLMSLFVATLIVITTMSILLLFFYIPYLRDTSSADPPLLIVILLAGSLGALFSALMRLYNFDELPRALVDPVVDLPKLHLLIYSLVPVVVGGIAATVLYVAFASKLVEGDIFPRFACKIGGKVDPKNDCASFNMLVGNWGPTGATDYAKALVWAFISGFAERFVPDMLGSLSRSTHRDDPRKVDPPSP